MKKITHLYIEPTSNCNIMCLHCPQPILKKDRLINSMRPEYVESMLNSVPDIKTVTLVGLGEPFLNNEIIEILKILNNRKIRVAITTNGLLLNNELVLQLAEYGVSQLSVSLDSTITSLQHKTRKDINVDSLLFKIKTANTCLTKMNYPLHIKVTMIRAKSFIPYLKQSIFRLKDSGIKEILLKNITILKRKIAKQESLMPDNTVTINQIENIFFINEPTLIKSKLQ
jgi:MoaA/NifB/PqqE/SkfB family radical SAM enzyme